METKKDNFPQTLLEAIRYFSNPDTCLEFMIQLRWPNGITCPRCACKEASFISTRRLWICKSCKKNFTVKQGTIMEDSPIGLDKWLTAIWMIAAAKNGISSWEVHRALGITQKSAWFLMHRIRVAMQNGSLEKLSGQIEADETFVGGKAKNMHAKKRAAVIQGRGGVGKAIVAGILERNEEEGASQVTVAVVPDRAAETLQTRIRHNVEPGSEICTDEWTGYIGLAEDYIHSVVNHYAKQYVKGHIHTNGMENFWTLFKRCIHGTYVSVEDQHLFRYLDEESFRFNNRKGNDAGRFLIVCASISGRRLTYKKLTGHAPAQGAQ